MEAHLDCYPCFARQALDAARMATSDEELQLEVLQKVATLMGRLPPDATPVDMGFAIHRTVREVTGHPDPYREVKKEYNDRGLALLPRLRGVVRNSPDRLLAAVKVAAVGNTIDFGADPGFDLDRSLEEGLSADLVSSDIDLFARRLAQVESILYVGDNAGEIAFDKILVEELARAGLPVTFVVRGEPIINDATFEDAIYVGMDELAEVVSSGVGSPGTLLSRSSREFQESFSRAELVLSKGQGNYEGLSGEGGPVFFLLKVKCPVVAEDLGAELGSLVFRAGG